MTTPSKTVSRKLLRGSLACLFVGMTSVWALVSCLPTGEPQSSSQTNWYRRCQSSVECGDLECVCGACTTLCSERADCRDEASLCLELSDERAGSFCEGAALTKPVCVQTCGDESCPVGTTCRAGLCQVTPEPDSIVTVNITERHQTLIGFGASLAYAERVLVEREDRDALYDALFSELGADTVRIGNGFEPGREADLEVPAAILVAATSRLGRAPTVLITSASPPANLKANGARQCEGEEESCTLARLDDGSFNYAGFAEFWRASLDAYADAGIEPDYISIQNNPNWTPPTGISGDACRFLPEEGTLLVGEAESEIEASFPGYVEAARAVLAELDGLSRVPALFGPETTSLNAVPRYEPALAAGLLSAVGIHLYGANIETPRTDELNAVRAMATYYDVPVFQSEAMTEGLEAAVLIHHSTVEANATAYLQNDFISRASSTDRNVNALIQLEDSGFVRQSPYYAIRHFARNTDPGWVRVDASATGGGILASAWISPDEDALTLILVNPTEAVLRARLDLAELRATLGASEMTQTIFNAALDHVELGELPEDGWIEVPAQSAMTVALEE